jgi:hypothetical protein
VSWLVEARKEASTYRQRGLLFAAIFHLIEMTVQHSAVNECDARNDSVILEAKAGQNHKWQLTNAIDKIASWHCADHHRPRAIRQRSCNCAHWREEVEMDCANDQGWPARTRHRLVQEEHKLGVTIVAKQCITSHHIARRTVDNELHIG